MRRRDWDLIAASTFRAVAAAVAGLAVAVLFLLFGWAIYDCREQDDCTRNGGTVERYNITTVLIPVYCGSGCMVTAPTEVSDWDSASPQEATEPNGDDVHEVQFLVVTTSKGAITVATHVVHNGYYGGFSIDAFISTSE
jgi:hypothetical protein